MSLKKKVSGTLMGNPLGRKFMMKYRHEVKTKRYMKYFKDAVTDEKLIVFESFMGNRVGCSPKAIYDRLLENGADFHYAWIVRGREKYLYLEDNPNTEVVEYNSDREYELYAKAKFWITNSRLREHYIKRDDQIYIQTWHGSVFKRAGLDIKVKGGNKKFSKNELGELYRRDAERYNYFLSTSTYASGVFQRVFGIKDRSIILETGYPRNDFLFNYTEEDVKRVKKMLGIENDPRKIILYAPTWRDDQYSSEGYTYESPIDFDRLREQIGDEYIFLFRAHYFITNSIDLEKYRDFVINVSDYDEINDFYIIADLFITDYSSAFYDYSDLERPIVFFMYDYHDYKDRMRDFYFGIEELPGPSVFTQDELVEEIKDIDRYREKYGERYDAFRKDKSYLDDGNCAQRVIDLCINSNL